MKRNFYSVLVAAMSAVAIVGCTSDDDVIVGGGAKKQLTFAAVMDGGSAQGHASERMKTQLASGSLVYFCSNDAISVFDGTDNNKFTTSDAGETANFSGAAASVDNYWALYPYQETATIEGNEITAVLPKDQYAPAAADADTFDPQAVLSVAMTTSSQMTLDFKNVCGLIKFETTEPLAKVVFKGNNNEKVAGTVIITVGDTYVTKAAQNGFSKTVTLLPSSPATTFAPGTYYIAVRPQEFEQGFTIDTYEEGNASNIPNDSYYIYQNVSVERSEIMNIGKLEHEYVDFGIEVEGKKVLWATMNVGASAPQKYGAYFAWGEIEPKSDYSWSTYKWCKDDDESALTKYCNDGNCGDGGFTDDKTVLDLDDDAARVKWRGDAVTPTTAEWQALYANTTFTWTANYNNTGVAGYEVKGKDAYASKSIFLPAAGGVYDTSVSLVGSFGCYWSSSLWTDIPAGAFRLDFNLDGVTPELAEYRYLGYSVRPVLRMAK